MVTTRRSSRAVLGDGTSAGGKKVAPHRNGSGSNSRSRTSAATKDRNSKAKKPKGVTKARPTSPTKADLGIDDVVTVLRESLTTGFISLKSFLPKDIPRMAGQTISPEVFSEIYQVESAEDSKDPLASLSFMPVLERWLATCSWDTSQLISAWNSLGGKISAFASVIITEAGNDKLCHFTIEGLNNWIRKLKQKDDSQVTHSAKQTKWFLEAFIWYVVLEHLDLQRPESGSQSRISQAWNAWVKVYKAVRDAPAQLLSEVIKWRAASIHLFFATQGPLPAESLNDRAILRSLLQALGIQTKFIGKICDTDDVPGSPEVKRMADQVARQAMWVTTFMLGLELDCEVMNSPVISPNVTANDTGILVKYRKAEGEDDATLPVRLGLRTWSLLPDEELGQTHRFEHWKFEVPSLPQFRIEDERRDRL